MQNIRSQQWLQLEISFYYTTLIATVVFLILQHFIKLEVRAPVESNVDAAVSGAINDDEEDTQARGSKQFVNVNLDKEEEASTNLNVVPLLNKAVPKQKKKKQFWDIST